MAKIQRQTRCRPHTIPALRLSERSRAARDRALHAIAAMRRDPDLRLTQATKLHGVRVDTIQKYIGKNLQETACAGDQVGSVFEGCSQVATRVNGAIILPQSRLVLCAVRVNI
jgi:hypothetical protein